MMPAKLSQAHLERAAYVYVRQSTPTQVLENQESRRRQYGLTDRARTLGFQRVEVVDEDLRNLSTTMGHSTGLIREQCPVW